MTSLHMIYIAGVVGAVVFFIAGASAMALRQHAHRPPTYLDATPIEVERVVEVRVPVEVPVRVEVPVERIVERRVEVPVERIVERRVEVPVERIVERRVNVPVDRVVEKVVDRVVEKVVDRVVEKVVDRPVRDDRELDAATARIAELERQLGERTRAARELSTEHEQLKGRLRDAEGLRAEYVRLRTAETDAEYLKSEVARLESELRTMHVEALGIARPTRQARGSVQPRSSPARTVGESLATAIDRFSNDGTRSIAVADAMGFPLACAGNDGGALAAYAALLFESATKSKQFLPLAAPARIELVDDQGTRVSVWTFEVDGDRLLLADLAVTPVDTTRVESTLSDLSAILAPTRMTSYT